MVYCWHKNWLPVLIEGSTRLDSTHPMVGIGLSLIEKQLNCDRNPNAINGFECVCHLLNRLSLFGVL